MKYSEKEIAARKQMAMAAANFFVNEGFEHVTVSLTRIRADVTLFLDSAALLSAAEQQCKPFMIDGASTNIGECITAVGNHYYYLELDWL